MSTERSKEKIPVIHNTNLNKMDLPPSTTQRIKRKGIGIKDISGTSKFLKYGLPFILLVVGGSFALREFQQVKFKYFRNSDVSPEDMAKYGVTMKKKGEVTLETEFEKISKIDIDNWKNIRGPRPWEE